MMLGHAVAGVGAGFVVSVGFAWWATRGATKDLDGYFDDALTANASRLTRLDVASVVSMLTVTNGLLSGILAVLMFS